MTRSDTLARLRAYAAANPTDVAVVVGTVRADAECEALDELAALAASWQRRNYDEKLSAALDAKAAQTRADADRRRAATELEQKRATLRARLNVAQAAQARADALREQMKERRHQQRLARARAGRERETELARAAVNDMLAHALVEGGHARHTEEPFPLTQVRCLPPPASTPAPISGVRAVLGRVVRAVLPR